MIKYNDCEIEFSAIGLFTTNKEWLHPVKCEKTYEIIYVTEGEVFLYEDDKKIDLKKGELVVLQPFKTHGGYKTSTGKTAFYWLHFTMNRDVKSTFTLNSFSDSYLFKKLLHYNNIPTASNFIKDSIACHILGEIKMSDKILNQDSLASNIIEWTRINSSGKLSVKKCAEHFGYNSDYISFLIKKEYKKSLKSIINDYIIKKANEYLLNTSYSIKEISNILEFESPNNFVNYYKYHENISPSKFRNHYYSTHMNNK